MSEIDRSSGVATEVLLLSDGDIQKLRLGEDQVLKSVTDTFLAQARGDLTPVPRTVMGEQSGGRFLAFPGYLPWVSLCGMKWLSVGHTRSDGSSLPLSAQLVLSDIETGRLLAILDARWITLARTVAVTVLAALKCADPRSSTIGFIGAGPQAVAHLQNLAQHFKLSKVLLASRRSASTEVFLRSARDLGLEAIEVDQAVCVANSDILISAVSAHAPLQRILDETALKPGAFVSLVDLGRLWDSKDGGGIFVVDDAEQYAQLRDASRIQVDRQNPVQLCDIVSGSFSIEQPATTVFIPTGFGAADLTLGDVIVREAKAQGIGKSFDFG